MSNKMSQSEVNFIKTFKKELITADIEGMLSIVYNIQLLKEYIQKQNVFEECEQKELHSHIQILKHDLETIEKRLSIIGLKEVEQ